jgi:hypothetical protein
MSLVAHEANTYKFHYFGGIWREKKDRFCQFYTSINVRKGAEEKEADCVKGGKTNYNTSFEFEEAEETMTELRNEAVLVRCRHRHEATNKTGVTEVYSIVNTWNGMN